jgi:hypothetical protein
VDVRLTGWHLWGFMAGVFGLVANMLVDDQGGLTDEQRRSGAAVVAELERGGYHIGVVAGLAAVVCLLLWAGGWRRATSDSATLAAHTLPLALAASAAALLVAYGFRGGLAEYLPGGVNDDNFPREGLYVLFIINDTAPWFGWLGVVLAAGLVAWLAFSSRSLPRWIGVVSAVAVLPPVGIMVASGAVAIAGVVGPLWLVVASAGLALTDRPAAAAAAPS